MSTRATSDTGLSRLATLLATAYLRLLKAEREGGAS